MHEGIGLGPGYIVLDGDPPPESGTASNFRPMSNGWMDQDATWYKEVGLGQGDIVLDGDPDPAKGHSSPSQFSAHVYCGKRSPISATAEHLLADRGNHSACICLSVMLAYCG